MLEHAGRPWSSPPKATKSEFMSSAARQFRCRMTVRRTLTSNPRSAPGVHRRFSGSLSDIHIICANNQFGDLELLDCHSLSDSEVTCGLNQLWTEDLAASVYQSLKASVPTLSSRSCGDASEATASFSGADSCSDKSVSDSFYELSKKKRVSFADEQGLDLASVKTMDDDNFDDDDVDSAYSSNYGEKSPPPANETFWKLQFPIPATQYVAFREKLEQKFVSLENVFMEADGNAFSGTVKVKNIGFEKRVTLNVTFNNWKTMHQMKTTYQPSGESHPRFDTFVFQIYLPLRDSSPDSNEGGTWEQRVEFAVCFECAGQQYWDNNDGQNYALIKENREKRIFDLSPSYTVDYRPNFGIYNSLTDFRAWDHFSTEISYY